jgi:hypothetical protein
MTLALARGFILPDGKTEACAPPLLELLWELADDARAEHVGHVQNLPVYLLVGRDVRCPVPFQASLYLGGRQVEMLTHHPLHLGARPVFRIRAAQERSDLVRVGKPAFVRLAVSFALAAVTISAAVVMCSFKSAVSFSPAASP